MAKKKGGVRGKGRNKRGGEGGGENTKHSSCAAITTLVTFVFDLESMTLYVLGSPLSSLVRPHVSNRSFANSRSYF